MAAPLILLDQGTTSSRAMVFDGQGAVVATAQQEFRQHFAFGWVDTTRMTSGRPRWIQRGRQCRQEKL